MQLNKISRMILIAVGARFIALLQQRPSQVIFSISMIASKDLSGKVAYNADAGVNRWA